MCRFPDWIPVIIMKRKFLENRATRTIVFSDFLKITPDHAQITAAGLWLDLHPVETPQGRRAAGMGED